MVNFTFLSPGVSIQEIDLTGIGDQQSSGIGAGVIGTAQKGRAFVPTLVPSGEEFVNIFGLPKDGARNGPLGMIEWLRNSQAGIYLRVLGSGKGNKRESTGNSVGRVDGAGFIVGDQQPQTSLGGNLGNNAYAVAGGPPGRSYFLGCYMSESAGSTYFSSAGIQSSNTASVIIRGVLLAASGVVPQLSATLGSSDAPSLTLPATLANLKGSTTGSVKISSGNQEFVMLLNGHKGTTTSEFPNVVSASFDMTALNYFGNVFNKDPLKLEEAGYVLYSSYDIHPNVAVITGSGLISVGYSNPGGSSYQNIAFLVSGSQTRNSGSTLAPNYESFEDRYTTPKTPWVVSQKFGGQPINLFRFHAIDDGVYANSNIKVSIENIRRAPNQDGVNLFGSFDIVVRSYGDNDSGKKTLERFSSVNLNPKSPRYISKIVGDANVYFAWDVNAGSQKVVVDSKTSYPNRSKFIRVEVTDAVENLEVEEVSLPVGFRGLFHLVTSGTNPLPTVTDAVQLNNTDTLKRAVQPPVPFRLNLTQGSSPNQVTNRNFYWGVQFELQNNSTESNATQVLNKSLPSWSTYFPKFHTDWLNPWVGDNEGTADQAGTILDADRFNNQMFTLENIQVVTSSGDVVDLNKSNQWTYVRGGNISANATNKTRAWNISDLDTAGVSQLSKFTFPLQGGFDGVRIFNKDTRDLTNAAVTQELDYSARGQNFGPTVVSYDTAIDIMSNTNDVDIKLFAIPGIRNSFITDTALAATERRFDALYIMDIQERDTTNAVVSSSNQLVSVDNTVTDFTARGLNSSFGAAYFPDAIINDKFTGTTVRVPPSVAVLGAFSYNDAVSFPWFAPAGFARGSLANVDSTSVVIAQEDLDNLYPSRINSLVKFGGVEKVVVWGQKTLFDSNSELERVNVRRLLIEIRRQVHEIANTFIFEPNRETTLAKFSSLVQPILKKIQEQQGIDRYKVKIDLTTTTQADVENNTVRGRIYVQPTNSVEFVEVQIFAQNSLNQSL